MTKQIGSINNDQPPPIDQLTYPGRAASTDTAVRRHLPLLVLASTSANSQEFMASHVDIDKPRYDQSTFGGRLKHFYLVTNPLNMLASDASLNNAKRIIDDYRQGKLTDVSEDKLWRAKYLYDSAFHPETGDKMFVFGRMSSFVPMATLSVMGLLLSYNSTAGILFWNWFNQSYNALLNFTNRSGGHVDNQRLAMAYVGATGGALTVSLGLKSLSHQFPPVLARLVPYSASAAAQMINVPLMRKHELRDGINLHGDDDEVVGTSRKAARRAIAQVTFCRIVQSSPCMVGLPIIMHALEKRWAVIRRPLVNTCLYTTLCGFLLALCMPMGCAVFHQRSAIAVAKLEPDVRTELHRRGYTDDQVVYYNKGL